MVNTRDLPESLAEVDLGVIDVLKALKEESDTLRVRLKGLEDVKSDFDPAVFSRVQPTTPNSWRPSRTRPNRCVNSAGILCAFAWCAQRHQQRT